MKPDLPAGMVTPAEAEWVEGELVRGLMRSHGSMQLVVLLVPVFIGVLWQDAQPWVLGSWAFVGMALVGVRFLMAARYRSTVMFRGAREHLAFYQRWRFAFPVSGMFWGVSTLLFFDRTPLTDQFLCWLMLAGLAMFSINALSSQLETMLAYLNALALTTMAVMVWRIGVELQFSGPFYHWWLVALLAIFWLVLREAGVRLHRTHRRNFELQYRNNQLIESLTRQTQAALDAVEIKNRFLASAAHDLRQPVHALGLYADWLRSEPELAAEITPKIVESTKAVNQLFDSLFDLARLDAGKVTLRIDTVDLAKLLRDLELQYRPLAEAKGLELRVRVQPGTTVSDPILLRRILGNLISNAVRYTRRGGVLVATRGGGRRIEIWDTGVGIAPVHQREIFREFYKVPTHGGTEEGFGLGLYIVARLTHILGHPLTLSSLPGRGTVFRLQLLPTDPQVAAERAAAAMVRLTPMERLAD